MQYQPDIHTISKTAPPSYAEVMAQSAVADNTTYVPTSGQPTMYDQNRPQMSGGYPSSPPVYQQPSNFYSNTPAQPSYNPSYVPIGLSQQSHTATTVVTPCIVNADALGPRVEKTCCKGCSAFNKKIIFAAVGIVLFLYLIKVTLIARSM